MNESFAHATTIAQVIDLVIAFTLIECAALALWHRFTGKGVAPRDFAMNMVSGLCLMLALRGLAHDVGAAWVASCLLAAGVAHGTDILMRWRRQSRRPSATARVSA